MKLTATQVVSRARSATGKGTKYKLGYGGFDPNASHPAQNGLCDCSGFAAYCLGISRDQLNTPGYEERWIETTRVYGDAKGDHDLFRQVEKARPGDVIVYPDKAGKQGHIGIISAVTATGKPAKIIHCNASTADAIVEESAKTFWSARGAIYARPVFLEVEEADIKPILVRSGTKTAQGYLIGNASYFPTGLLKAALTKAGWTIKYEKDVLRIDPPDAPLPKGTG
jgi:hypothetical protein